MINKFSLFYISDLNYNIFFSFLSFMNIMIEPNITIVTAFFDIGRGDWTKDKGHPKTLLN